MLTRALRPFRTDPRSRPTTFRPHLEALEDRTVPSAPGGVTAPELSIGVTYDGANNVTIFGWLTGAPNVGYQPVDIDGMVVGSTHTGVYGFYEYHGRADALGSVQSDAYNVPVQSAWLELTNPAPTITNFQGQEVETNVWVFSGTVNDDSPEGLEIRLRGIPSLDNVEVAVDASGHFEHTAVLSGTPSDNGTVIAELYDWYSQYTSATFEVLQSGS
jgi:hypothetical protein